MRSKTRPSDRTETMRQARTWDMVKTKYVAAGLCHKCAAQAAWGHQLGFGFRSTRNWPDEDRGIKPPCETCAPIVATFPVPAGTGSPWRRFERGVQGSDANHTSGSGCRSGP